MKFSRLLSPVTAFPVQTLLNPFKTLANKIDDFRMKDYPPHIEGQSFLDTSFSFAYELSQPYKTHTIPLAHLAIIASASLSDLSQVDIRHHGDSPMVSSACHSSPVLWAQHPPFSNSPRAPLVPWRHGAFASLCPQRSWRLGTNRAFDHRLVSIVMEAELAHMMSPDSVPSFSTSSWTEDGDHVSHPSTYVCNA